jgi:hypothetical protein
MADKIKMVNVKLAARCLVNDQVREAGETVDLPETTELGEPYAVSFGEIVKPASSAKASETKPE